MLHEGHSIVIDIPTGPKRDTVMLPLRNGFPIHASDRLSPVFALYNHFHEVVGLAMKIRGFGLPSTSTNRFPVVASTFMSAALWAPPDRTLYMWGIERARQAVVTYLI